MKFTRTFFCSRVWRVTVILRQYAPVRKGTWNPPMATFLVSSVIAVGRENCLASRPAVIGLSLANILI